MLKVASQTHQKEVFDYVMKNKNNDAANRASLCHRENAKKVEEKGDEKIIGFYFESLTFNVSKGVDTF